MAASPEPRRTLPGIGARLLAAAVLVPLAVLVILAGGWVFALATAGLAAAMLAEFESFARARGQGGLFPRLLAPVLLLLAAFWRLGAAGGLAAFCVLAIGIMGLEALRGRIAGATARAGEMILALVYLGMLPGHFILLRELPLAQGLPYRSGADWALFGATVALLGDTFAYVIGSLAGRHPLGTPVSPRKSVEGVLAGLAGALIVAWLLAPVWMPFLAAWQVLLVGLLLSTGAQLGDLFESLLKRDAALKDSGTAIPGHGGWLDRLDSLLFAYPLLYYFLRWIALR